MKKINKLHCKQLNYEYGIVGNIRFRTFCRRIRVERPGVRDRDDFRPGLHSVRHSSGPQERWNGNHCPNCDWFHCGSQHLGRRGVWRRLDEPRRVIWASAGQLDLGEPMGLLGWTSPWGWPRWTHLWVHIHWPPPWACPCRVPENLCLIHRNQMKSRFRMSVACTSVLEFFLAFFFLPFFKSFFFMSCSWTTVVGSHAYRHQ